MLENRPEQERKKIFWLIILSITAVIFIVWLILFAKGFVLRPTQIVNQNSNQADLGEIKSELKSTINEFKELNIKQKFSDIKDEFDNLKNNQNQNQNENTNVNELNENTNQPENNEPVQQNQVSEPENSEYLNNTSIPRLPVEN